MKKLFLLFALVLTVCDTMMASANDPQIPADEIWYTTIDGQVLNPYITDAFGATISSNTYKNGKGIIKFDRLVTNIGNKAFWYCSTLNSITIPNTVTNIGPYAFADCPNLTDIAISNALESIGNFAFARSGFTSITIPSSVTNIVMTAFENCPNMTTMSVEHGNTVYDSRNNCNAIIETETNTLISGCKNSVIPTSVTSIGKYAFRNCSFTSITIPNSITTIENTAFAFCTALTSIEIPNSVTTIGTMAFADCPTLESITFMSNTPPSNDDKYKDGEWLYNCSNLSGIYVPDAAVNTYKSELCSYADIIKPFIEKTRTEAIAEITSASKGIKNAEINAWISAAINDIQKGSQDATPSIDEIKDQILYIINLFQDGKAEGGAEAAAELLGEMGTKTAGHAVEVSDGTTTVTLYNPKEVNFIKVETEE